MSMEREEQANYDLITTKDGEMEIIVAGATLKVPEDLPRLSQLVGSTTLVVIPALLGFLISILAIIRITPSA